MKITVKLVKPFFLPKLYYQKYNESYKFPDFASKMLIKVQGNVQQYGVAILT